MSQQPHGMSSNVQPPSPGPSSFKVLSRNRLSKSIDLGSPSKNDNKPLPADPQTTPTPSAHTTLESQSFPATPASASHRSTSQRTNQQNMDTSLSLSLSDLRRSPSSRSTNASVPSPLADFQSDDVLNAPPWLARQVSRDEQGASSPISGPEAHIGPPPPSLHLEPSPPSDDLAYAQPSQPMQRGESSRSALSSEFISPLDPLHRRTGSLSTHMNTGIRDLSLDTQSPVVGRNPFQANGLHTWTRETWGKRKVALISGITGQDGSYLTELLLSKGYVVHGIIRRSSSFNTSRLHHLFEEHYQPSQEGARVPKMILHYGDLTDSTNLVYIISQVQPSEIYNLGAQSHVKVSFEMAEYTGDVDGIGTLRLLDAIRTCGLEKLVRFYQASTSEMFGQVREIPQNEQTPFYPRSPYGCAKLYAYWTTVNYREAYGMFACNGILFNHESPRRGRTFVTRKITRAVAEISLGKQECMYMGNLDAMRDWGHASDYVEGMWRILQHDNPEDFVLASGENHSVREFIEKSFAVVGIRITWQGKGIEEIGLNAKTGKVVVRVDPKYFRPAEVEQLLGDPTKAEKLLGWQRTICFESLIKEMVLADVTSAKHLVEDHN